MTLMNLVLWSFEIVQLYQLGEMFFTVNEITHMKLGICCRITLEINQEKGKEFFNSCRVPKKLVVFRFTIITCTTLTYLRVLQVQITRTTRTTCVRLTVRVHVHT